ncbi:hypothetical protein CGLO_12242 [Colletotrichum gloeosporioides Cg-14]|uniref:Uncharacterized protein n=1 Tax=Colletotrichum gloeosporioides (strain Cg-14) TaxID=1237896 RepID=T0LA24_COLGC|nr:hypothetical protein CGLO_12242 [Colletotrichum gloeosporioides Cg-14]
MISSYHHSVS